MLYTAKLYAVFALKPHIPTGINLVVRETYGVSHNIWTTEIIGTLEMVFQNFT